jgi:hypothetical protein
MVHLPVVVEAVFAAVGVDSVVVEEVTVLPTMPTVVRLRRQQIINRHHNNNLRPRQVQLQLHASTANVSTVVRSVIAKLTAGSPSSRRDRLASVSDARPSRQ